METRASAGVAAMAGDALPVGASGPKAGSTRSGSTISGGTISGGTISGGTISGGTISGGTISGGTRPRRGRSGAMKRGGRRTVASC
jgi:hypothetical protein